MQIYQSFITAFVLDLDSKCEPDCRHVDGEFRSTPSTAESLRHLVPCVCDDNSSEKLENIQRLESIWKSAIEICQSSSYRSFLRKHGRLSSVCVSRGQRTRKLFVGNCWCLAVIVALHSL